MLIVAWSLINISLRNYSLFLPQPAQMLIAIGYLTKSSRTSPGDCFLKAFQDTDDTVYTVCHGTTSKKNVLFGVVGEICVFCIPKCGQHGLKIHFLKGFGFCRMN
jgi:hypothetical protein